jgi:hypothetical protein
MIAFDVRERRAGAAIGAAGGRFFRFPRPCIAGAGAVGVLGDKAPQCVETGFGKQRRCPINS